jgi:hypothetical protein
MGCGKKTGHSTSGCVCDVVRAILDIQDNVSDDCGCASNCFMEPLGAIRPNMRDRVNTRVFTLKNADGSPFHAFFKGCPDACVSIYFRVEEVFDNCCATLRVLKPLDAEDSPVDLTDEQCCIDLSQVCQVEDFEATNDCVTVDLSCFCAIQCIEDVFIDLC